MDSARRIDAVVVKLQFVDKQISQAKLASLAREPHGKICAYPRAVRAECAGALDRAMQPEPCRR